ncbi:MAG: hemolysin III family protein [Gemmatimonadota bacterium]|nr:hemolysin III family protein [Gemmatimonadota bacterium]MDH3571651.1 hemolysin III family protein [Gemmatimonadota bacterium]MDH5550899.1 hemolysin III family protein [Gemmatimonadota bacterium]
MDPQLASPRYSVAEEVAHAITHGVGLALSVAALTVLVAFASLRGNAWHVVSCSIYGATLVLLYAASTLYHAIPSPRAKDVFRILDHSAIYLLIAGTYTPFTLVNLRGGWGWTLFGLVWGLAILGIVLEAVARQRIRFLSVVLYLGLGWLAAIAVKPLLDAVEIGGLVLLLVGGLAYSGGVVFYGWRRLPYHHAIWHVFVMVGSAAHFFAVLYFVIPPKGG